jgi:hypothetical protein
MATPPSLTLNVKWRGLLVSSLLEPSPSPQKQDGEVIMGCDVVHITLTTQFGIGCHHHHPSLTLNTRWRGFLLPFSVDNPSVAPNTRWRDYLLVVFGNSPLPHSNHEMEGFLSLSTPPPSCVMRDGGV